LGRRAFRGKIDKMGLALGEIFFGFRLLWLVRYLGLFG
jgi:hypothetical protein